MVATVPSLMVTTPLTKVRLMTARQRIWTASSNASAWVPSHLSPYLTYSFCSSSLLSPSTLFSLFVLSFFLSFGQRRLWTRKSTVTLRVQTPRSPSLSPPALKRNTKKLTRSLIKWCRTIGCQWVPPTILCNPAPPPPSPPNAAAAAAAADRTSFPVADGGLITHRALAFTISPTRLPSYPHLLATPHISTFKTTTHRPHPLHECVPEKPKAEPPDWLESKEN